MSDPDQIARLAGSLGDKPLDALLFLGGIWEDGVFTDAYSFEGSPPAEAAKVIAVSSLALCNGRPVLGRGVFHADADGRNAIAERGIGASAVGLFALLPWAVVLLSLPFLQALQRLFGFRHLFLASVWAGVLCALTFLATQSWLAWCAAAVIGGFHLAALWGLTDTLIAGSAPKDEVGRITGIYQTLLAAALLVGPILPLAFSLSFVDAAPLGLGLTAIALFPVAGASAAATRLKEKQQSRAGLFVTLTGLSAGDVAHTSKPIAQEGERAIAR